MKNHQSGVRVARRLQESEKAVDQAMIEIAMLLQTMIEVRKIENVAAEVGQLAITHVASSLAGLAAARGDIVASHGELAEIAGKLGFSWRMDGSLEQKLLTSSNPEIVASVEAA